MTGLLLWLSMLFATVSVVFEDGIERKREREKGRSLCVFADAALHCLRGDEN